jgi:hypothetical protein
MEIKPPAANHKNPRHTVGKTQFFFRGRPRFAVQLSCSQRRLDGIQRIRVTASVRADLPVRLNFNKVTARR